MKELNLKESSIKTSQNTNRVVMIYDVNERAIGNCFVTKDNKTVPKRLYDNEVEEFSDEIEFICYYEN